MRADAEALVNPVNCVGVMGKGLALQFKRAFPSIYQQYQRVCNQRALRIGMVLSISTGKEENPRYIIHFPTKLHWKDPSRIEYIEQGLTALVAEIRRLNFRSVAVPALGCGNGGLPWEEVQIRIERVLGQMSNVDVFVYLPGI